MAKIAIELERALAERAATGADGRATPRTIACGDGWTVSDVVCTSGPGDRPFVERHAFVSIAVVASGSFQYRSSTGRALMTPGAMMLGNAGESYECGHDHGAGDRCVAFWYSPAYVERVAADIAGRRGLDFSAARLPPLRATAALVARACAGLGGVHDLSWEEVGVEMIAAALRLSRGHSADDGPLPPGAEARVTQTVRLIEERLDTELKLTELAGEARLSPFHFLRMFERVTGLTPHRYLVRARLRQAAMRLADSGTRVLDVALDCGFGDVSNFNRAFRTEFGVSPTRFSAR